MFAIWIFFLFKFTSTLYTAFWLLHNIYIVTVADTMLCVWIYLSTTTVVVVWLVACHLHVASILCRFSTCTAVAAVDIYVYFLLYPMPKKGSLLLLYAACTATTTMLLLYKKLLFVEMYTAAAVHLSVFSKMTLSKIITLSSSIPLTGYTFALGTRDIAPTPGDRVSIDGIVAFRVLAWCTCRRWYYCLTPFLPQPPPPTLSHAQWLYLHIGQIITDPQFTNYTTTTVLLILLLCRSVSSSDT